MGGNLGAGAAAGNGAAPARAAHQHQRGPAVEVDAPFERAGAIGGQRGVRLRRQQAGQDDAGAGRGEFPQRRGQALQRPEQDVGEDESKRRVPADFSRADAFRLDRRRVRAAATARTPLPVPRSSMPALLFRVRGWGVRLGLLIDLQSRSSASRQPRVVP
jgi:hypothetical protein